jgi:flavin reductase (DIM6/NTAB) family NADH-FMN oxidoreductase RutF
MKSAPMLKPVLLTQAYRLLNHGPTVLVSTAYGNQKNVMAAAWNMPLDFNPTKIAIVIDKNTYTRELIEASGHFAINVPCRAQAEMVVQVGSNSGRELIGKDVSDKFAAFNLPTFAASEVEAPLLHGCVAWLECRLIPEPHIQSSYDLFLGEVLAAQADERVFSNGRWHFEEHDELRTIHHIAGGAFMTIGEAFQAKP